jgi:hypothetical protein
MVDPSMSIELRSLVSYISENPSLLQRLSDAEDMLEFVQNEALPVYVEDLRARLPSQIDEQRDVLVAALRRL